MGHIGYIERFIERHKKELNVRELYTTAEAAKAVGVSRQTLQAWIIAGKVKPPEILRPYRLRLWTSQDVEQLKLMNRKQFRRKPGRRPKQQGDAGATRSTIC